MKVAFCTDGESLGGGYEYIRRKMCSVRDAGNSREGERNETEVFFSDRGECRAKALDAWGADEIVVNHLKALVQVLGRPWERPRGRVRFVVHGIHLRKYQWLMRDAARGGLRALPGRIALGLCFRLRRILEAWLYRRCDEIVALTETDRADILRLYGKDAGVVVEPNTLEGWTPRRAEGFPPGVKGPFKYLCIGRFNYQKGQDLWIRGMGREEFRAKNGRTLFIGDGETLKACRELAADLRVDDLCCFAGAIPEADRYLGCADIVVSPSRWEGMPYLMMKARALGCRILATDCPGNRDVLAGYEKWERLVFPPDSPRCIASCPPPIPSVCHRR